MTAASISTHQKNQCSRCESFKVARIIYGMPDFTDRLEKLKEQGKIIFGGCCVCGNYAKYECTECGAEYTKRPTGKDPSWTGKIKVGHVENSASIAVSNS